MCVLCAGNLPTERVTKRDLFHIFHKYGKLAQVSIKQAYGFIQFLDSSACKKALDAEQGAVVRGRKIREWFLFRLFIRGGKVFGAKANLFLRVHIRSGNLETAEEY